MTPRAQEYHEGAMKVANTVNAMEFWRKNILDGLKRGGGGYTYEDVLDRVVNGQFKLIDLGDAYFIMQVAQYPQCKHYHVFLGGGTLQTMIDAVPRLKEEAKELGCAKVALNGRMGWWKVFKDKLDVKPYLTMTLEI